MIEMSLNVVHRHVREKRPTKKYNKEIWQALWPFLISQLLRFFCEYLLHVEGTSEKFHFSTISLLEFLLLPRERTLVAAGHVTSCDNGLLMKSQLTFSFFAAVSHFGGPLRKQKFFLTGSKGHDCDLWLVDFNPFCGFLCFKVRSLW